MHFASTEFLAANSRERTRIKPNRLVMIVSRTKEADMEEKAVVEHDRAKGITWVTIMLGLAAVVYFCINIARHWATFSWFNRSLVAVLLFSFVAHSIRQVRAEKKGERVKIYDSLLPSYAWLYLVTALFNR